jgi:hypothetical protein
MLRPINPIVISNSLGRIVITLTSLALLKDIPVKVVQEMHIETSEKINGVRTKGCHVAFSPMRTMVGGVPPYRVVTVSDQ